MSAWVKIDGQWCHRPWWKRMINVPLRFLQPWPRRWVIYSRCTTDGDPPRVLGYGFGRVLHRAQPSRQ